jgi:signal recognition particle receptor subunit beta
MNVLNTSGDQDFLEAKKEKLLECGLQDLRGFARSSATLCGALEALKSLGDENTERRAERLSRQLENFEPSVTMIGQIKSGKTTLVNALIGEPDLLPADVNPWTSVVTSLHLHPRKPGFQNSASFRFFDQDEWDRLISGGGRIGELASRAGADDELEKIKLQVAEMREKSRARLGRKFELLLGQQRDYGYVDKDLIERYVCLGEHPDEEGALPGADEQGRFADITKSADLSMQRAALPMRLCIRDTPGVNDTFMMREQITIRAIRDSRICVVVLSAHQALTSTDMALIRLISNVKSRDVIIFVNRIDELSDPASQVGQIRQSIDDTLRKHNGPAQVEVICGSALWASFALQSRLEDLPVGSKAALRNWSEFRSGGEGDAPNPPHLDETGVWQLSGLPDLQQAIGMRVVNGMGAALLQRIGASAHNLLAGIAAADRVGRGEDFKRPDRALDRANAHKAMREIVARHTRALSAEFDQILAAFGERMERVQESFLERATASLVVHLESYGELSPWTYDPAGLRVLLNASHKVLARKSQAAFEAATKAAASEVAQVYASAFSVGPRDFPISLPRAPQVPAPVSLARTIALDLSGSWWKRWWLQRRGYKAYAQSFHALIKSETDPVITELRDDLAKGVRDEACASFEAFLNELLSVFETLNRMQQAGPDEMQAFVAENSAVEQRDLMERTLKTLNGYALS